MSSTGLQGAVNPDKKYLVPFSHSVSYYFKSSGENEFCFFPPFRIIWGEKKDKLNQSLPSPLWARMLLHLCFIWACFEFKYNFKTLSKILHASHKTHPLKANRHRSLSFLSAETRKIQLYDLNYPEMKSNIVTKGRCSIVCNREKVPVTPSQGLFVWLQFQQNMEGQYIIFCELRNFQVKGMRY